VNINSAKEASEPRPRERKSQAEVKNLTGLKIRFFREKRGWTQQRLSESLRKVGISITRDVIANIETQRCPVTDCQIVLFARILDVSWKSLFPDKAILERFTPPVSPKRQPKPNPPTPKRKFLVRSRSVKASRKAWNFCEMTCKSVKVTFRGPS
jgi:transcriptional regulator with XRE-family HTH domain